MVGAPVPTGPSENLARMDPAGPGERGDAGRGLAAWLLASVAVHVAFLAGWPPAPPAPVAGSAVLSVELLGVPGTSPLAEGADGAEEPIAGREQGPGSPAREPRPVTAPEPEPRSADRPSVRATPTMQAPGVRQGRTRTAGKGSPSPVTPSLRPTEGVAREAGQAAPPVSAAATISASPAAGGAASGRARRDAPAPAPAGAESLRKELTPVLLAQLRKFFRYPPLARRRGWEGQVLLGFRVETDGQIANIHVARSSGYPTLDRSATHSLEQVDRVRFQGGRLEHILDMTLPVIYRLREG